MKPLSPPTYRNQLISLANSVAEESEGKGLQTLYSQFSQGPPMTVNIYVFSPHECPDFTAEETKVRRNYLMCPRSNS